MTNESLKREEFIRRKKDVRSAVDMMAQQLTNVYRQLSVLGNEASESFNQLLLREANPEVLSSLKTIPGGEEVRDYYNFLTHTVEEDSPFGQTQEDFIDGVLPKAEQMSPIWESFGMPGVQGGVGNQQKPIQMSVVNPIRASVITSLAGGATPDQLTGASVPQQSKVDFPLLQSDITEAYERQRAEIAQALNFIVIDSNIEKMHQNLKIAINTVTESLDHLKEDLDKIVQDVSEKAAFPEIDDSEKELEAPEETAKQDDVEGQEQEAPEEAETEKVRTEKVRRTKAEQKFPVDMTDDED